jgi:hypothetical protein
MLILPSVIITNNPKYRINVSKNEPDTENHLGQALGKIQLNSGGVKAPPD